MPADKDFEFEFSEKYVGDADQVKRIIDECPCCGSKLVFNHLPDYKNLLIQENARCLECGEGGRKIIHVLN